MPTILMISFTIRKSEFLLLKDQAPIETKERLDKRYRESAPYWSVVLQFPTLDTVHFPIGRLKKIIL